VKFGLEWKWSMEFELEWKWPVIGPSCIQKREKHVIYNTARVSCDVLAKNRARIPNLTPGRSPLSYI
jgi:hypothetical protein